jgi:hypothetical protein
MASQYSLHEEMVLNITDSHFYVSSNSQTLCISRADCSVQVVKQSEPTSDPKRVFGIVGVIELSMGKYLVTVKSRNLVGAIGERKIWKIGEVSLWPFHSSQDQGTFSQREDDKKYSSLLQSILQSPLYFSYDMDITNTYQRRSQWTAAILKEPLFRRVDPRFWWNRYLLSPLINPAPGSSAPETYSKFILPMMMGFVVIHHVTVSNRLLEFAIFSRRHTRRAGCRYIVRGIDASGAVANFVETEQIVLDPESHAVHSFVQVRGSIPVFWTQLASLKYAPTIAVQTNRDAEAAFQSHFSELQRVYGQNAPIVCASLINLKGSELKLANEYNAMVQRTQIPGVEYYPFDFHKECPGTNFAGVSRLVDQITPSMNKIGWFMADNPNHTEGEFRPGTVLRTQNGVIRTNCIDNLDRTNVGQSAFAKVVIMQQLFLLGYVTQETRFDDLTELKWAFQNAWADNANALSTQYAGTGALKTDFTRTGKRSLYGLFMDGYNSIMRYFLNNFKDGVKQDAYNLTLGIYRVDPQSPSPFTSDRGREQLLSFFLVLFVLLSVTGFTKVVTHNPYLAVGYWCGFVGIYAAGIAFYGKKLINLPVLTRNGKTD